MKPSHLPGSSNRVFLQALIARALSAAVFCLIGVTALAQDAAVDPPSRVDQGLAALYRFDEPAGQVVHDAAPGQEPLDLRLDKLPAVVRQQGMVLKEAARIMSDLAARDLIGEDSQEQCSHRRSVVPNRQVESSRTRTDRFLVVGAQRAQLYARPRWRRHRCSPADHHDQHQRHTVIESARRFT